MDECYYILNSATFFDVNLPAIMWSFFNKSDAELLLRVREGNKRALILIFRKHFPYVKRFIIENGGNAKQARDLLKGAIAKLWTEASSFNLNEQIDLRNHLIVYVRETWLVSQSEIEIKSFIEARTTHSFSLRKKISFALGSIVLLSIALWWYFDMQPVFQVLLKEDLSANQVAEVSDPTVEKESKLKQVKSPKEKDETSSDSKNMVTDSLLNDEADSVIQTIDSIVSLPMPSGEDEMVVRKDELLFSRILQVIFVGKKQERSLADETAKKLNPEASLPEDLDSESMSFGAEFWKSPVNYRGYKMGKSKIIFYGIDEADWVKLYNLNDVIYMEYANRFYQLEATGDFNNFNRVNNPAITSLLKK